MKYFSFIILITSLTMVTIFIFLINMYKEYNIENEKDEFISDQIDIDLETSSPSEINLKAYKIFVNCQYENIAVALTQLEDENIIISDQSLKKDANFIYYTYTFQDKSKLKVKVLINKLLISKVEKL